MQKWRPLEGARDLDVGQPDSRALGGVSLAPRFTFQTPRYSEEIFLQLAMLRATELVINPTLLNLSYAI